MAVMGGRVVSSDPYEGSCRASSTQVPGPNVPRVWELATDLSNAIVINQDATKLLIEKIRKVCRPEPGKEPEKTPKAQSPLFTVMEHEEEWVRMIRETTEMVKKTIDLLEI